MAKTRKPIKQGSFVKFYGYTSLGKHCYGEESGEQEYVMVTCDWDAEPGLVCTEIGDIERQQVSKIKKAHYFWCRVCQITQHQKLFYNQEVDIRPTENCQKCKIIRVREVKE